MPTVPSHWFAVFTPSTWGNFISIGSSQLGFGERSVKKLKNVRVGDIFIAYISSAKKIGGVYRVTGEFTRDGIQVWKTAQFPFCLPVQKVFEFDLDAAPEFLSLASTQSWFNRLPNKKYWSFVFRNPPRLLKSNDGLEMVEAISNLSIISDGNE